MSNPLRGEVWLGDLGFAAKVRPALVISIPATDDDRALLTIIPHTTACRGSRFEVSVKAPFLKAGAFDSQQVITISNAKLIHRLGVLTPTDLAAVEAAFSLWLGLRKN